MKSKKRNKQISNIKTLTSNNAITLIVLVITIIVLLILSAVTLSLVLGESGIIAKARLAKEETNVAQEQEEQQILDLEDKLDNYNGRETGSSKRKVLFNWEEDEKGMMTQAGTEDENSERIFNDDIKKYDMVQVLFSGTSDLEINYTSSPIDKLSFNMDIWCFIAGFSYSVKDAEAIIKIDTENNKIIYQKKGHEYQVIKYVIGYKF